MSASDQKYSDKPDGKAFPVEPWHTYVGMSDQEIRARALEATVAMKDDILPGANEDARGEKFWATLQSFEHYIKTGEKASSDAG